MSNAAPRRATLANTVLLWTMVALLGLFLIYPILLTIRGGFADNIATGEGFTFRHLALVFADPVLRGSLANSALVATLTTTLAVIIALPLAILAARYKYPLKGLWNAVILVPLILPPFVGAIGARAILGREGALNALLGTEFDILGSAKLFGVVCVQALSLYPIIYLNATAALANLDPALDEAAENLGAGSWRRLFRITLPLVRPGLFAGATIVFIWSFTELGTPLMFDYYNVAPVKIFYGLKEVENSAQPYALTVVLLVAAVGMYALGKLAFGGRAYAMYSKASRAGGEKPLTGFAGIAAAAAFALVTFLAILPHMGVVLTSITVPGQWYQSVLPTAFTTSHFKQALTASDAFGAIVNSITFAAAAMVLNVFLGIVIAYLIVRTSVKGRAVLDALCMLPLAVPGLVLAFGYVAMSLRWPFAGKLEFPLIDLVHPWALRAAGVAVTLGIVWCVGMWINRVRVRRGAGVTRWSPWWVYVAAFAIGSVLATLLFATLHMLDGSNAPLKGVSDILGVDPNPIPLLIIAYAVRRLPYIVRSAVAGLEQTSGELEEAAVNLGASRVTAVRRVIVPLIMANLIAGGLLVFAFSMLEVSDSLILAQQQQHYPITRAIFGFTERLGDGHYIASALGVWGMALLAITLVGASIILGKKLGSIFRV